STCSICTRAVAPSGPIMRRLSPILRPEIPCSEVPLRSETRSAADYAGRVGSVGGGVGKDGAVGGGPGRGGGVGEFAVAGAAQDLEVGDGARAGQGLDEAGALGGDDDAVVGAVQGGDADGGGGELVDG